MTLARTQLLALITKAVTTALGIVQSVIVIRILSPAEFGLVGLVMSVGGVVGVSQHLGIVDGAIREIAVLKRKKEIGKIFWVSHIVRQIVTIPLSVGLLLLAGLIAGRIYGRPEIEVFLQIFAAILVLQGLQDVLGATLTGMKRFVELYIVQIATATINVAVFGLLAWRYGISGFFWAIVITTTLMVLLLTGLIIRILRKELVFPKREDIRKFGGRVMRIGAYMYLARIFFMLWQRLPILMLGGVLTADQLGYLNVSQTFGSKLTIIAMALSEVNLSWMSSLYSQRREEFARVVTRNMQRVLVLMVIMTLVLLFFTPEILKYIIGQEYLPAQNVILVMTLGFFLYALTDIGTSSVFVPANAPKIRAYIYAMMTGITGIVIGGLLIAKPDPLLSAWAVLAGALASYVVMVLVAKWKFNVAILTKQLLVFLICLGAGVMWLLMDPEFLWRLVVFILLTVFVGWEAKRSNMLPSLSEIIGKKQDKEREEIKGIVCFAGAEYDLPTWTNRQQVMSRMSKQYMVLYVEPRVWVFRYIARNLFKPRKVRQYLQKLVWYRKMRKENVYLKAQWNLIPWSREIKIIGRMNHLINRYSVMLTAWWLGLKSGQRIMWIYDTEAAEYLSAFKKDKIVYDCVDDHARQAGVDRNPMRVKEEEDEIMQKGDLVTVTSRYLYKRKRKANGNVKLVLNAGDVSMYGVEKKAKPKELGMIQGPMLGMVGALDDYKVDFGMLYKTASVQKEWNFVFIGAPVVDQRSKWLKRLSKLNNVYLLGAIAKEKVPAYVYSFDVCLIPYRANKYNEASFPLKFWEFMATGKPIVVTGLPELKEYKGLIGYAKKDKEFIREIRRALKNHEKGRKERKREAKKHTWDRRVRELKEELSEIL